MRHKLEIPPLVSCATLRVCVSLSLSLFLWLLLSLLLMNALLGRSSVEPVRVLDRGSLMSEDIPHMGEPQPWYSSSIGLGDALGYSTHPESSEYCSFLR